MYLSPTKNHSCNIVNLIMNYVYPHFAYRNLLFFVVEIFSDRTCCPKVCYANIIPVQKFFSIEILLIEYLEQ